MTEKSPQAANDKDDPGRREETETDLDLDLIGTITIITGIRIRNSRKVRKNTSLNHFLTFHLTGED